MPNHRRNNPQQKNSLDVVPHLGVPLTTLLQIIENKYHYYSSFQMPKPDGTSRTITPPTDELKEIQRVIKQYLEKYIHWDSSLHGGIRGRSIITNARGHVGKQMVANLDVREFFPSITEEMVIETLVRLGCTWKTAALIAALTTYKGYLPQGAPTSTLLANLVFVPIDRDFQIFSRKFELTYTRYVDDITLSGNRDLRPFKDFCIRLVEKRGFSVADNKVFFRGRNVQQIVTGLIVNDKLRPTPNFLRDLRHDLRNCWPEAVGPSRVAAAHHCSPGELRRKLRGRIRFVHSIDPKLGRELRGLMVKIRWP
jgi:RNA-directed DNA polymerase